MKVLKCACLHVIYNIFRCLFKYGVSLVTLKHQQWSASLHAFPTVRTECEFLWCSLDLLLVNHHYVLLNSGVIVEHVNTSTEYH